MRKIHNIYSFEDIDKFYLVKLGSTGKCKLYYTLFAEVPKINQIQSAATTMSGDWELWANRTGGYFFRTTIDKLPHKYIDPEISELSQKDAYNLFNGITELKIIVGMR